MTLVDWIVVIILACAVLGGLAQGFFRSFCSLAGLILGLGVLGSVAMWLAEPIYRLIVEHNFAK